LSNTLFSYFFRKSQNFAQKFRLRRYLQIIFVYIITIQVKNYRLWRYLWSFWVRNNNFGEKLPPAAQFVVNFSTENILMCWSISFWRVGSASSAGRSGQKFSTRWNSNTYPKTTLHFSHSLKKSIIFTPLYLSNV